MKKLLTIVLALALVFSVAGTAFAFTGITEEETAAASKFTVDVELVDYNFGWKDGIYYKTPANRAYAINEVVGALVTVVVPAESDELVTVKFSNSNMKILDIDTDATDKTPATEPADAAAWKVITDALVNGQIAWKTENGEAYIAPNATTSNKTYKFFVTAQLKSDKGGSITAKVVDADDTINWVNGIVVEGATGLKFDVTFDGVLYTITVADDEVAESVEPGDKMIIKVGRDYKCKTMSIVVDAVGTATYEVVTVNGKIAFKSDESTPVYVVSGDDYYSDLLAAYNELADEFGFDYAASGYLYKSFFTKLDGSVTVSDTAYVEPALPSSALLPDLAVTIPQTGSVSFAGFAMIALAVAAAVAVKKAR